MNYTSNADCSVSKQSSALRTPLIFRVGAEFIASAFAMFTIYMFSSIVTAMYGVNVLMIAVGTGIAYAAAIGIASKFSGGHVNPAITIASMLTGRTPYISGILYIIAQVLGAIAAAGVTVFVLPQTKMVPAHTWFAPVVNGFENASISANQLKSVNASFGVITALVVEIIAVLVIVATAMTYMNDNGSTKCGYSTHMGIAYAAGAFITYQITGAGLNPARSTGIAILAQSQKLSVSPLSQLWVFWIAPIFAAALVGFVMLICKLATSSSNNQNPVAADCSNQTSPVLQNTVPVVPEPPVNTESSVTPSTTLDSTGNDNVPFNPFNRDDK